MASSKPRSAGLPFSSTIPQIPHIVFVPSPSLTAHVVGQLEQWLQNSAIQHPLIKPGFVVADQAFLAGERCFDKTVEHRKTANQKWRAGNRAVHGFEEEEEKSAAGQIVDFAVEAARAEAAGFRTLGL